MAARRSTASVLILAGVLFAIYLSPIPVGDPLVAARAPERPGLNREATVPPMCYTKTAGVSNPCWTCHTETAANNHRNDWRLQEEYAFSDVAKVNHWANLFHDRRSEIARIPDAQILDWVRSDNYEPLREVLRGRKDYRGWIPDLDYSAGFDDEGFARDGSGWRAVRYKPFPGTFWPTNGSADDLFIRLPGPFRDTRTHYVENLELVELALTTPASRELILPKMYVGGAASIPLHRFRYPQGTEFLHTVRYLDPDRPGMTATRVKEVRYSKKFSYPDDWAVIRAYEREHNDKDEGKLPGFAGVPEFGLRNKFGWLYQGFIEDSKGRLRLQTREEHFTCMGCHSGLGVTVDSSFAFPRKVPGADGWRLQDLRGIVDAPQDSHEEPEVLEYLRRVGGGDEFRANDEMIARFFRDGRVNVQAVRAAADLASLVLPSRERALSLNKAYFLIVRDQSFVFGRDAVLAPAVNVHQKIENGQTDLRKTGKVFTDGRLWLDWHRAGQGGP